MIERPTSHRFVSQRLQLSYVDWGNTSAPPLVLVHGGRDHCRSWDWTAQALRQNWHIIAIDLRGHGDSEWTSDGNYLVTDMVYDIAQLVHQLALAPVTIIAHSLGGQVCTRFAGTFPEQVRKLVAIEALGITSPTGASAGISYRQRLRLWVEDKREASGRMPRRYRTVEEALVRMQAQNAYLNNEQALHLTLHGVNRNEDGSFSWKFDPHLNIWSPAEAFGADVEEVWRAITAPTLMLYGADSFATNPRDDGRIRHFATAEIIEFENAGHWLHHDQFDRFLAVVQEFIRVPQNTAAACHLHYGGSIP